MEEGQDSKESKYIQQHLANERTFLAWIRTAIATIGIGFLATSLHFNSGYQSNLGDKIAVIITITSVVIGFSTIIGSTINYFRVRKNINKQTFTSSISIIIFMSIIALIIVILIAFYFIFI